MTAATSAHPGSAGTTVRFGAGVAQQVPLLSPGEVGDVLAAVDAVPAELVHAAWATEVSRMSTIGEPLYRNRDRLDYYTRCAQAENRRLYRRFRLVHERVAAYLEQRHGRPVVFAEDLAVPGFHVFEYADAGEFGGGDWHFDRLYLQAPYLAAHADEVDGVVNVTLPLAVPSGGTGIDLCDDEPGSPSPGTGAPVSIPYVPGVAVLTERDYWHRLGPSTCRRTGERRVTYQGHGALFRGQWVLFW